MPIETSAPAPAHIAASAAADSAAAVTAEKIVSYVAFALTAVLVAAPVGYLIYGAFRSGSPTDPDATFTLANIVTAYGSRTYHIALFNTLVLSFVVAALSVVFGSILAWIVSRTDAPGRHSLALVAVTPLMISNLITALAWIALAAPNAGFINAGVRALFGIPTTFDIYSFAGIVLVMTLHYIAFVFVAMLAALRSIDASLEEASFIAGAGPLSTAFRMTLPLVWPTITATFLMTFILASENFSVPTLLGIPIGLQTLPSRIYTEMTVQPAQPALAAAGGTLLLWIAVLGTFAQRRVIARASRYVTVSGKGARTRINALGPMRYVATGLLVLYVFLAVILPYVTLIFSSFLSFLTPRLTTRLFTFENYHKLASVENVDAVVNSIVLSVVGGATITAVYVFLAFLIKRSPTRAGLFMDYLILIPTAIPALVLAVGVLWVFVGLPLPIYGTISILVIAYFVRFIGYGVRQSRVALTQISEELSEAARVCGASPLRTYWDVVVPLLRNATLSLWTLMFIFIFTEVSATILLYSPTTVTLPVALWNYMAAGHQTAAFAIAVAQATLIFVLLIVADQLMGTLRNTVAQ
jgi:iron(III) transport system permease protein